MKKNKLTRLAILVLALAIGSMMIVSGTYAKYTSSATGTSTATVAKWSFELNGEEIASTTPQSITLDLFDTILDTLDDNDEEDVVDGKIAPGTYGEFQVTVENTSEVTAAYTLTATVTNDANVPIEFSTDNGSTWVTSLSSLNTAQATTLEVGDPATTATVQWRWAFEGADSSNFSSTQTDTTDTTIGIAGTAPTVTVTLTVTATQVD